VSVAAVLAASLAAGCAENDNDSEALLDPNDPVTVTIWHYYNGVQQTYFDNAVSEFNNTVGHEKGIIAEAFTKNSISELSDSVIAAVNKEPGSENPPDIFATYSETAYVIDKQGYLADIKNYFTDGELSEYIDEYIDEGEFGEDGSLKIFPTAKSTEIMMINLTDWQKFADSENVTYDDLSTWEGVTEVSEKYYNYTDSLTPDTANDGKAFFGRDSVANYMYIGAKQLGCEFASESDGTVTVDADEAVIRRLWDNYYVPYVKGYYTAQSRYRSDDAKTGKIIAMICSTTGAAYYPTEVTVGDDYTYPIENAVLPVPNFENTDPYIVQQGAGMSVIKSDERKEYASALFLKWFTEEERNIEFSVNSGYLPVKKAANDFSKISSVSNDMNDTLTRSLETAIGQINSYNLYAAKPFSNSTETRDFLGDYIQDTASQAHEEAFDRINAGEDRAAVMDEYTGDKAFEEWYNSFITQLTDIAQSD
ncbi:MAG: extracellular solute-binding protein, partial [Ruminococcus sp.]|nr:extracellular solute-binding protein [Ruminococcus sp.]